jgi:hypothetical protein
MGCYEEDEVVQILAKGTNTVLYEVKMTAKTCSQMFVRLVFFKYGLEKGTYSHRKKRS